MKNNSIRDICKDHGVDITGKLHLVRRNAYMALYRDDDYLLILINYEYEYIEAYRERFYIDVVVGKDVIFHDRYRVPASEAEREAICKICDKHGVEVVGMISRLPHSPNILMYRDSAEDPIEITIEKSNAHIIVSRAYAEGPCSVLIFGDHLESLPTK